MCVCVCVCAKREQIGRAGGGGYLCLGEEELLAANEVRRYEFLLFLRRRKGSWSTSREILPALSGKDLAPAAVAVAPNAASSGGGTAARIAMAPASPSLTVTHARTLPHPGAAMAAFSRFPSPAEPHPEEPLVSAMLRRNSLRPSALPISPPPL